MFHHLTLPEHFSNRVKPQGQCNEVSARAALETAILTQGKAAFDKLNRNSAGWDDMANTCEYP